MGLSRLVTTFCVAIVCFGCALFEGKDVAWLEDAQGQATQEQVRKRWGEPTSSRLVESGESLWIYEKREEQPGNRYAAPGTWCEEYALTFDNQAILRHWTHRSYFHGGELMPARCIPDKEAYPS